MKSLLLALAMLCGVTHAETLTAVEKVPRTFLPSLAFGLPDLVAVRLATPLSEHWELGAALGLIPATHLIELAGLKPQNLSTDYELELSPTLMLWAPQFFARVRPGGWSGAFVGSLGVLLVRASARGTLHHITSDARATVAEITTTLTQPFVSVAFEYPLHTGSSWELRGSIGAMWLWSPTVRGAATGLLPAFAATNPEAMDSYDDAIATAERELNDALSKWNGRPPILPSLNLTLAW